MNVKNVRLFFLKQKRRKQRIFPFSSLGSWCVIVSRTKWWRGGGSMGSWAVKVRYREMALAQGHNWLGREPACTHTNGNVHVQRETAMWESWAVKRELSASKTIHTVIKEKWSFFWCTAGLLRSCFCLSLDTFPSFSSALRHKWSNYFPTKSKWHVIYVGQR